MMNILFIFLTFLIIELWNSLANCSFCLISEPLLLVADLFASEDDILSKN